MIIVGHPDNIIFGGELDHAGDRAKDLFPVNLHIRGYAGEDGGHNEIAFVQGSFGLPSAQDEICPFIYT
jgi:hypothetical protein